MCVWGGDGGRRGLRRRVCVGGGRGAAGPEAACVCVGGLRRAAWAKKAGTRQRQRDVTCP